MKYVQPYGIVDPNASYINGNPATGVQGSIPPAMVFENPQREVANLITDSAQTPSDGDLRQLGKGVQRHSMNYAVSTGAANTYAVTLAPVPDGYNGGFLVIMRVNVTNTGPSTLNVNSKGPKNIVHPGGAALRPDTLLTDMIALLAYDGTNFQIIGAATEKLFAPRDYYVNDGTGSDTNSGLTAGSAFKTIQKAVNTTNSLNLNGYDVTIHVADGTYLGAAGSAVVNLLPLNGTGNVYILGNETTPASCYVHRISAGNAFYVDPGARNYFLRGFKVAADASGANPGHAIRCPGQINLGKIDFGACAHSHCSAEQGGQVGFDPSSSFTVSGGGINHLYGHHGGIFIVNNPALTVTGTPVFSGAFWNASMCAVMDGSYSSITGSASAGTKKFSSDTNAAIATGTTTLPGGVAGTQTNGGVYVGP